MKEKKTILLNWGYNRKNWVENFESLNEDFEFVYLYYMYPEEEEQVFTKNRRIYFTDFSSPAKLLKEIRPDKVVFMGIDGLQTIALNIECKKQRIPTFFMVHGGATLSFDYYETIGFKKRNLFKETFGRKLFSWVFTFRFLLSALGFRYISFLPALLRYQVEKTKRHALLLLKDIKNPLRKPDKYLVYSEPDREFYMELDEADPEDIYVLGNLEFTDFAREASAGGIHEKGYLLYIETPLSVIENSDFEGGRLSPEEYNEFLAALNNYALSKGLQLYIKLHPYAYDNTYYFSDPNITYIKGDRKERLILDADAVIFCNSSLAIPALYYKPACMFIVGTADEFQKQIEGFGICGITSYRTFIDAPQKVSFEGKTTDRSAFAKQYIGANTDGSGLNRLRDILNSSDRNGNI